MVTTGIKLSSNVSSALVSAMYGRSSELGLYQTYTSAHLFDTLVTVLDQGASEADPGATDCKLTLTALHHMGANDDLLRPHTFVSFTPKILSDQVVGAGSQIIFFFKFCKFWP